MSSATRTARRGATRSPTSRSGSRTTSVSGTGGCSRRSAPMAPRITSPAARCEQFAQLAQHRRRILENVAVGVAPVLVAAGVRLPVALAVLLERVTGVVEREAVELDRDLGSGPAAVDAVAVDDAVDLVGAGEARFVEAGEEPPLQ